MNKKNIILIIITVLSVVAVVLICFSVCITRKIDESSRADQPIAANSLQGENIQQKEPLAPSRAEDYGFVSYDQNNMPKTQGEWDALLVSKVKESKAMLSEEEKNKMRKVIEEDPKKTADKIKLVDENIKKCNNALKANPNNQEMKDKLTRYMMLKSISKELAQE